MVVKVGRSLASKTDKTSRASKNGEFIVKGKDKRVVLRNVEAARSHTKAVNYSSVDAQDHSEKANTHLLQAWHKLHATHVKRQKEN